MFELYRPGQSFLHRLPAGAKVLALALCGTVVFLIGQLWLIAFCLLAALALYPLSRLPLATAWAQIRPALWILVAILIAQGLINGWTAGAFVVARFAALLLLAGLLTLTTRVSDMIDGIERGLWMLKYLGLNPAKISLALSLALRFIPVLAQITAEVREAQKVRGLDRSIVAVAVPVVTRTLRMSDDIAEAIEARGYNA
ncbi:energy-coupling factor transporter transmembrane component T family protein [Thalassococcus sp. BH17M4-6]|uniref:energy-coupling factor transporter transmembrane component T family protein n=1 Tax=Thalassococcus sp. BH17M4-6 TaxID=3413148 RepID=UPI003BC7C27D